MEQPNQFQQRLNNEKQHLNQLLFAIKTNLKISGYKNTLKGKKWAILRL